MIMAQFFRHSTRKFMLSLVSLFVHLCVFFVHPLCFCRSLSLSQFSYFLYVCVSFSMCGCAFSLYRSLSSVCEHEYVFYCSTFLSFSMCVWVCRFLIICVHVFVSLPLHVISGLSFSVFSQYTHIPLCKKCVSFPFYVHVSLCLCVYLYFSLCACVCVSLCVPSLCHRRISE